MPFFQDAAGIMNGGWCVYHLTGPHLSPFTPFSSVFDSRHRNAGACPTRSQVQTVTTMPPARLEGLFGLDASHQAIGKGTHRTHQCISVYSQISRVRSGCAVLAHCMSRAVPGLITNTGRVRAGDGR